MRSRDLEKRLVQYLFYKHHDLNTTLRKISRELQMPYSTVRDVVQRLEAEGVVYVLRLEREHVVRLKDVSKALERGYLTPEMLFREFGYTTPLAARKNGVYIGDELFLTSPFKIRRHEAFDKLIELELKSRQFADPYLAGLGEWPRLSLLFYRAVLTPDDNLRRRWLAERGLESLGYYEPAYGFFAFLLYALRKTLGVDWEEAYCKALGLVEEYIKETRAGEGPVEGLVDEVLKNMRKICESVGRP
ncbi:TrmB family transcriptional regulator [Pyrobaculum aerophilum]|uniref:TrmB family transcriptional regulator n=1 Tax=Pyrobaculum aerophilum TaxID=13773 RepID=UPI0023F0F4CF|nr:TrmB family transcriptional regulator [Pyrobaculum aerophilum]MCX8136769.1 TrmB family transcriptional regulator [Pyrobaculum aerophilum]